ncbi:MAG: protein kinase [Planctomycetales bacterium]|nr:protein kinase [Planctomycetales bacterium]
MNHCAHCNSPLDEGALVCPQCGEKTGPTELGRSTIRQTDSDVSRTVDLNDDASRSPEPPTGGSPRDTQPAGENTGGEPPEPNFGTGTVSAPGVRGPVQPADEDEDDEEIEGELMELEEFDEEEFLNKSDHVSAEFLAENVPPPPGKVPPGTPANAPTAKQQGTLQPETAAQRETVEADAPPAPPATPNAGTVASPPPAAGDKTVNVAGDDHATHVVDSAAESPDGDDEAKTVVMSSDSPAADSGKDKTLIFDSTAGGHGTHEVGGSGTEGRLKRLWERVAGSSANIMHSLQGVGLQAADSVFERVATRRVADANAPGGVLADYQIVDKLGEGAMGIVFSARQTAVDRIVAIKTAKPNYQQNDESRRRFLYEAHITADLDHSNIVPIHELGASEEGMLFYSMKLVQGTEWSRVIHKKSREENLEIFMKVADAIAFAHSKGTIHRDIKPENTMLGRFGEVFVTDWGTAINLEKDSTYLATPVSQGSKSLAVADGRGFRKGESIFLHDGHDVLDRLQIANVDDHDPNRLYLRKKVTREYQPSRKLKVVKVMNLAGTPCYMAPEMAGHQLAKIGKASDIYILGAVLFDIVTGHAPHTGNSVTQCLRAALQNEIVPTDSEDALLTIARRAMATEPEDRYPSVEALQDAVREYRRHAESIALTERSEELLELAIAKNDYEMFSRTLFGYRDAIDLWPQNQTAATGLLTARLAFGQSAFKKGDYDLVLQTLDRSNPEELALYDKAVTAKKKSQNREATLKMLQKAVAAIVLFAVAGLSALSLYAFNQSAKATRAARMEEQAKIVALQEKQRAEDSAAEARRAEKVARDARDKEEEARLAEETAKLAALQSAELEKQARSEAVAAQKKAEQAAIEEEKQRKLADQERIKAEQARDLATRRSAEILLGEYNASLALAKSQIESFDVAAGRDSLQRLQQLDAEGFQGNTPDFDTWGWQRIQLLSNADLPSSQLDRQITASAYAPQANMAVLGTADGLLQILRFGPQGLSPTQEITEAGAAIHTVAISPTGQEIVYGFTSTDASPVSGMKRWLLSEPQPQPVQAAGNRQFQRFAYATDGQSFMAGINGGIWIWQRSDNWPAEPSPTRRVESIRGDLTNLQAISPRLSLLTARFQDQLLLGLLDSQTGSVQWIDIPEDLAPRLSSAAHTLVDNQLILGLSDHRLLVAALDTATGTLSGLLELEEKHRAPVTQIVSNGKGQVITANRDEPVAHVWRAVDKQWEYDTYLTGTSQNIAGLGLLQGGQVLGVDAGGSAIVWDVQRQKQRRRLQRQDQGQSEEYWAPVQQVFAGSADGNAVTIDAHGVVDLWSLSDGSTQRIGAQRWSYIGHTPGAELVDSAVDLQRGVVVTAARLRQAEHRYLANPSHDWEFCLWDVGSGAMQRRWTSPNRQLSATRPEAIEQRISLLDQGRKILFASDNETRILDLLSGQESFRRGDFGTYFATPNPHQPESVMLVKRSGALRLFNLGDPASWENPALQNFSLADPSDIPLRGIWSADGQRYYLTFATGGLAAFHWTGQQLELTWSSRKPSTSADSDAVREALLAVSGRVKSHLNVDLQLRPSDGGEKLIIATRNPGLRATTRLVSLQFPSGGVQPTLQHAESREGIAWLQNHGQEPPSLSTRLHDVLLIDSQRIRSRLKLNDRTFVSTAGAQVYGLVDGQAQVVSYGRPPLVSATGSRDGQTLYMLLEDGALWKFSLGESQSGNWNRLSFTALGAQKISLSPDGTQLLIQTDGQGQLVRADSGHAIHEVGPLLAAAWDPQQPARLAVCRGDGSLEVLDGGQTRKLDRRLELPPQGQVRGLHFFNETWKNAQTAPRQHLLVHSESADNGSLQFFSLDPPPAGAVNFEDADDTQPLQLPSGTLVTTSPQQGVIVTGAPNGTVTVWFATPTYERNPRPLFDLEGHRGADMTCLTFSSDGQTLITADDKHRLFAWLSRDPLSGK